MPRIRCHYLDCIFLDERYCSAAAIEINPDAGCLTIPPMRRIMQVQVGKTKNWMIGTKWARKMNTKIFGQSRRRKTKTTTTWLKRTKTINPAFYAAQQVCAKWSYYGRLGTSNCFERLHRTLLP